jgi:hypothetical protein
MTAGSVPVIQAEGHNGTETGGHLEVHTGGQNIVEQRQVVEEPEWQWEMGEVPVDGQKWAECQNYGDEHQDGGELHPSAPTRPPDEIRGH